MLTQDYIYNGMITNIVDGDTVDAQVDLGFTVWVKIRFRLYGLDTPEMNSSDPVIREKAKEAKQFVVENLLNKEVQIKSHKTDKYGRWLGEIFIKESGNSINQMLLENNLAVAYFGGAKSA